MTASVGKKLSNVITAEQLQEKLNSLRKSQADESRQLQSQTNEALQAVQDELLELRQS